VNEDGRIVNNWVGTTLEYRWRTRRFDPAGPRRRGTRDELPSGIDDPADRPASVAATK
jgi:hypothetical protein